MNAHVMTLINFCNMQIKPEISEVTPCQVLITTKFYRQPTEMTGVKSRKAFETLLSNMEKEGKDPIIFIRDHLKEKTYIW